MSLIFSIWRHLNTYSVDSILITPSYLCGLRILLMPELDGVTVS